MGDYYRGDARCLVPSHKVSTLPEQVVWVCIRIYQAITTMVTQVICLAEGRLFAWNGVMNPYSTPKYFPNM